MQLVDEQDSDVHELCLRTAVGFGGESGVERLDDVAVEQMGGAVVVARNVVECSEQHVLDAKLTAAHVERGERFDEHLRERERRVCVAARVQQLVFVGGKCRKVADNATHCHEHVFGRHQVLIEHGGELRAQIN